jgi:exonuclease SbcD
VVAGNHDHGPRLDALRTWAEDAGITLRGLVGKPEDHLITGTTSAGEPWRLAALPFVSQRYAVRASEMFELSAAEASATYADHLARLLAALTAEFADGSQTINLVTAHLTVVGAKSGGGERDAHTIEAYSVPSTVFPANAHYVALGHLHRRQQVPGPCPVHYCGSPIAVDFGEEENRPSVSLVELTAHTAPRLTPQPLSAAVPLRTVRGTLAELATARVDPEAWLRVYVREAPRAGLREQVQDLLPRALEVRVDPGTAPAAAVPARAANATARSPIQLFGEYLAARGVEDPAVAALFNAIYDDVVLPGSTVAGAGRERGERAPARPAGASNRSPRAGADRAPRRERQVTA